MKKNRFNCEFDFDIGYLIKSPCRDCDRRKSFFPDCSRECLLLDRIQSILATTVSCTKKS